MKRCSKSPAVEGAGNRSTPSASLPACSAVRRAGRRHDCSIPGHFSLCASASPIVSVRSRVASLGLFFGFSSSACQDTWVNRKPQRTDSAPLFGSPLTFSVWRQLPGSSEQPEKRTGLPARLRAARGQAPDYGRQAGRLPVFSWSKMPPWWHGWFPMPWRGKATSSLS